MTRSEYEKYLQTEHWRIVAAEARTRADYHCQLCGDTSPLINVHHNNYDHIGSERPSDVIVLCRMCHRKHHGKMPFPPVTVSEFLPDDEERT